MVIVVTAAVRRAVLMVRMDGDIIFGMRCWLIVDEGFFFSSSFCLSVSTVAEQKMPILPR
jgi:hypothetical protein